MASSKANAGDLEACTSSNQVNMQEKKPNTKGTNTASSSNLEKALAKRALYGSRHRHAGGRRAPSNAAPRSLPSRLSKVSLAEDATDKGHVT